MSAKRGLLTVLCTWALLLVVGGASAFAWFSESISAATIAEPRLGGEISISILDNQQSLPAIAYNSIHDEYLVVWQNTWGGNKDIYARRVNGRGQI